MYKYKQKTHKTIETQIYVVHPIWAASMQKQQVLPFILSKKIKRYNLQHIHYNSLFGVTQSPLSLAQNTHLHMSG